MAKFISIYLGSMRCENLHEQSGTRILTDAPTDNMGKGSAFSPTDLCALSLTTCIITTMGIYAATKDFAIASAEASTIKHMASDPRRIACIEVELVITLAHDATERQIEGLRRIASTCPVSRSLHPDVEQKVSVIIERRSA